MGFTWTAIFVLKASIIHQHELENGSALPHFEACRNQTASNGDSSGLKRSIEQNEQKQDQTDGKGARIDNDSQMAAAVDSSPWTPLTSGQLQAAAAEHEEVYKPVTP